MWKTKDEMTPQELLYLKINPNGYATKTDIGKQIKYNVITNYENRILSPDKFRWQAS